MNRLFIPIILGTAREGRRSEHVARFMMKEAEKRALETTLVDVRDFLFGATDDSEETDMAKRFSEIITRADGLIIVSPEYNHGYPGELKLLLDSIYKQYARKPVGICGVSDGSFAGVRMVEQSRLLAIEYHMVPISRSLYFPSVQDLFDESGTMKNPEAYQERLNKFFDELLWYAEALTQAREKN